MDEYKWQSAQNHAKTVNFAGYSDWRVPTIAELSTLVYCSNGKVRKFKANGWETIEHEGYYDCRSNSRGGYQKPTINQLIFPNTPVSNFWSASPYANYSSYAWLLDFYYGYDDDSIRGNAVRVRLVRSGQ